MNDNLRISIVTVCFNATATIKETILSVVNQTYDNVEYIIIDGGSTDGTVEIIKKYTAGGSEEGKHNHAITKWISEPDKGIYDAMNKGIDLATGDYINFMNAGDTFVDCDVVSKVSTEIDNDTILIYGDWNIVFPNGTKHFRKSDSIKHFKYDMPFCHQAVFINLKYHKLNKYNLSFIVKADYNFTYQIFKNNSGNIKKTDIIICNYENFGISSKKYKIGYRENYRIWGDVSYPKKIICELNLAIWDFKQKLLGLCSLNIKSKLQRVKLKFNNTTK